MTTHLISGKFCTNLGLFAPTLVKNDISYYYNLRLTFLQHESLTFLPVIVVVILWIKSLEQNIALKQLKDTPRSMAVQLQLNLVEKIN